MAVGTKEKANRAFQRGEDGYYVVNPATMIAVAGPYSNHGPAQRFATEENRRPPVLHPLEVRLIGRDPVWP